MSEGFFKYVGGASKDDMRAGRGERMSPPTRFIKCEVPLTGLGELQSLATIAGVFNPLHVIRYNLYLGHTAWGRPRPSPETYNNSR